jgi:hypothetical protein
VFGHFERDDLVKLASLGGEVSKVGTEDPALRGSDAVLAETVVTERGLLLGEGDCAGARSQLSAPRTDWLENKLQGAPPVTSIVRARISGQSTPSTTDIQQPVRRFEVELFTDEGELVVLELFKGLELGRVRDDP